MIKYLLTPFKVFWQAVRAWWDSWTELFLVNLIVLLCWLTIILGPPATFGFYALIHQMLAEGTNPGLRALWEGARKYAVKSWLWFGGNLLVIFLAANAYLFYRQMGQGWSEILRWLLLFLAVGWIFFVQFYTIPFLMVQETKSLRIAWRNATLTSLASPGYTLILVLLHNIIVVVSIVFVVPLFFIVPVMPIILGIMVVNERLEAFEKLKQKG